MSSWSSLRERTHPVLAVPPTFVAPAWGMIRHASYFTLAMLAGWGPGWIFLATFSFYTWHFLRRLQRFIELRVYTRAGLVAPEPQPFPRIRLDWRS